MITLFITQQCIYTLLDLLFPSAHWLSAYNTFARLAEMLAMLISLFSHCVKDKTPSAVIVSARPRTVYRIMQHQIACSKKHLP